MLIFRRSTLWCGCSLLALAYAAAEELADGAIASTAGRLAAPPRADSRVPEWDAVLPSGDAALEEGDAHAARQRRATRSFYGSDTNGRAGGAGLAPKKIRRVCRVTAYCDRGTTAAGTWSGIGQCAAPADIPFGSKVYIPALKRTFIVTDRTHRRFRRNTVDLFIPSEKLCRQFGERYLECEFTLVEDEPAYGELRTVTGG